MDKRTKLIKRNTFHTIRMTEEEMRQLKDMARKEMRSVSQVIYIILTTALKEEAKK